MVNFIARYLLNTGSYMMILKGVHDFYHVLKTMGNKGGGAGLNPAG